MSSQRYRVVYVVHTRPVEHRTVIRTDPEQAHSVARMMADALAPKDGHAVVMEVTPLKDGEEA